MNELSTIRAFQKILPNWVFDKPQSWSEDFAIKRYLKKMESPDDSKAAARQLECWERWLSVDSSLPEIRLPNGAWYRARLLIHSWLSDWEPGEVDFTNGSEFTATRGRNSIEAKLSASKWECTHSNFENFSKVVYYHKALKRAARCRYNNLVNKLKLNTKDIDRRLWLLYGNQRNASFEIFRAKLRTVTTFVQGSRFSTVPKNNSKDRPINIEPLGNILFQRMIGIGIRSCLKKNAGLDLESLQHVHRAKIANLKIATIDFSDASDSVSMSLCEFLLPAKVLRAIRTSRSDLVLGLDSYFHPIKKVSSMGNGFTFELMTILLTALCRTFDEDATVYGDDIIIDVDRAPDVIQCLEEVGFTVNKDKSFIDGPFRESCGANWHSEEGYVKSFDFVYPTTIHDCIVLYNKVVFLSIYGSYRSFSLLEMALRRTIDPALRGLWLDLPPYEVDQVTGSSSYLTGYFKVPKVKPGSFVVKPCVEHKRSIKRLCYAEITASFYAFTWVPTQRTRCLLDLTKRNWAKYEMYLASGRRVKDTITGQGEWVKKLVYVVDNNVHIEARSLSQD